MSDSLVALTNRGVHNPGQMGVHLIDTTDPAYMSMWPLVTVPAAAGLVAHQGLLYVVSHEGALYTVDLSDLDRAHEDPKRVLDGLGNPWEIVVVGQRAYIADNSLGIVTVDISEPALDDARENFRLNGIDPGSHAFEAADAFGWTPPDPVDVLICDPPNLSHGKGSDRAAAVAYRDLNRTVGAHVRQGGLLASASCTARLSRERWEQAVRDGLRNAGRWSWVWRAAEPPDHPVALDHPEGRYLKFAVLRRRTG